MAVCVALGWPFNLSAADPLPAATPTAPPLTTPALPPPRTLDEQLATQVHADEMHWLESEGNKYLVLFRVPPRSPAHGTIILVPGRGMHLAWPEVIAPLSTLLPRYGWNTLVFSPPPLTAGDAARFVDHSLARLQKVFELAKTKESKTVILLGYEMGGALTAAFIPTNAGPHGLVLLGTAQGKELEARLDTHAALEKIPLPILDVIAAADPPDVQAAAQARLAAAQRIRVGTRKPTGFTYRLHVVPGADARYSAQSAWLTKTVAGWLKSTFVTR